MGAHHILLIEDNPGDVRLIEESLRAHALDYRISHYETADAAIHAIACCGSNGTAVPDLILIDYNIPRGDARDILAAASKNPALNTIPKAIVTSFVAPRERQQAVELGATCFINKPQNLDSFLTEVGATIVELLGCD
jgi:CheY-like chemotaxis protein